jgi:peptidoglycan hydrolase-like protein with peptidoglycan-binding domain
MKLQTARIGAIMLVSALTVSTGVLVAQAVTTDTVVTDSAVNVTTSVSATATSGSGTGEAVQGTSGTTALFHTIFSKGQKSDEIATLQEILRSDTTIYPEGIVTGYFGSLTEAALKRLQARYGIAQTGILDDGTRQILYPSHVELAVVSPNGGEEWAKGSMQNILWKTKTDPVILNNRQVIPELTASGATTGGEQPRVNAPGTIPNLVHPFYRKASIILQRDSDPSFRYHIGTVDLYQSHYRWHIPGRLHNGTDYRIAIIAGNQVPCLWNRERDQSIGADQRTDLKYNVCPLLAPASVVMDTSDMPFAITGQDDIPPPLDKSVIVELRRRINAMEETLKILSAHLTEMAKLLQRL